MLNKCFFDGSLNTWLGAMLFLLFWVSAISFALYGPYYSPDTVNYFTFSKNLFISGSWSSVYSPLYPFILQNLSLWISLSLFKAATLIIILQYALGIYALYSLSKIFTELYKLKPKSSITFTLLVFIVYHSWWSFRITSWAHADATFYALLIAWSCFFAKYLIKSSLLNLLIFSLLSAILVWVKLNAIVFIPFFLALLFFGKNKKCWWIPLLFTSASYGLYRYLIPKNLLETHIGERLYHSYLSLESFDILWSNIAGVCKVTLGFFISDVLTDYIPHLTSLLGGIFILALLTFLVIREIKKGLTLPSFLLLFGLIYLLCLLSFQQMALFEEINYRTLFPFFISGSWYLWAKLLILRKYSSVIILVMGLLMTSHTILGHLWLWKRQDVNSLFEVDRLMQSEMREKIQSLQDNTPDKKLLLTDYPAKLSLLMADPFAIHYDPDFLFIRGKRRPVSIQKRQRNLSLNKEKLLNGQSVLVLFDKEENLEEFIRINGLQKLEYQEGIILWNPSAP